PAAAPARAPGPASAPSGSAAPAPQDEAPLPLPRVNPEDGAQARYAAVLDVLEACGVRWYSLVEHSVALSWSGEELKVAFSQRSLLEEARGLLHAPALRPVLERAFPGLRQIEPVLREAPQGRPATRHEARKDARARAVSRLRADVEQDPAVCALRNGLGFAITEIVPPERIPTEETHDTEMEASP
ncbi:MAG: hypothetical protein ABIO70_22410, partial [Pseudomonadota bacterium]